MWLWPPSHSPELDTWPKPGQLDTFPHGNSELQSRDPGWFLGEASNGLKLTGAMRQPSSAVLQNKQRATYEGGGGEGEEERERQIDR